MCSPRDTTRHLLGQPVHRAAAPRSAAPAAAPTTAATTRHGHQRQDDEDELPVAVGLVLRGLAPGAPAGRRARRWSPAPARTAPGRTGSCCRVPPTPASVGAQRRVLVAPGGDRGVDGQQREPGRVLGQDVALEPGSRGLLVDEALPVGLEEPVVAGERVAAQARLLVDQRGQQLAGRDAGREGPLRSGRESARSACRSTSTQGEPGEQQQDRQGAERRPGAAGPGSSRSGPPSAPPAGAADQQHGDVVGQRPAVAALGLGEQRRRQLRAGRPRRDQRLEVRGELRRRRAAARRPGVALPSTRPSVNSSSPHVAVERRP